MSSNIYHLGRSMMNLEEWFAPALELGQLIYQYTNADAAQRVELEQAIRNCTYIVRLYHFQTHGSAEFLQDMLPDQQINSIRRDFFITPAVPVGHADHLPPNPYHRHDYFELVFVLKGMYVQWINGVVHELHEGEACMINPEIGHRDRIPDMEDRVIFMGLSSSFVDEKLMRYCAPYPEVASFLRAWGEHSDQQYIHFTRKDFAPVQAVLEQMIQEDADKLPGHHLVLKGYLVRLLNLLCENHQYTICCQSQQEINETLLREIQGYMYQHLTDISRTQVAEFFHFHPDSLNRFLIRSAGENYSGVLNRIRMEKAAYELRQSDKSVAQIISEVGIANRGYFNQQFVKQYGMLPSDYRKM